VPYSKMDRLADEVSTVACSVERASRNAHKKDERRLMGTLRGLEYGLGTIRSGGCVDDVSAQAVLVMKRAEQAKHKGHPETEAKLRGELDGLRRAVGILLAGVIFVPSGEDDGAS